MIYVSFGPPPIAIYDQPVFVTSPDSSHGVEVQRQTALGTVNRSHSDFLSCSILSRLPCSSVSKQFLRNAPEVAMG